MNSMYKNNLSLNWWIFFPFHLISCVLRQEKHHKLFIWLVWTITTLFLDWSPNIWSCFHFKSPSDCFFVLAVIIWQLFMSVYFAFAIIFFLNNFCFASQDSFTYANQQVDESINSVDHFSPNTRDNQNNCLVKLSIYCKHRWKTTTAIEDGSVISMYRGPVSDPDPMHCKAIEVWMTISARVWSCALFPGKTSRPLKSLPCLFWRSCLAKGWAYK